MHCQEPLQAGDEVVECPRCHAFHHVDCWKRSGGCSRHGCPQVAKAVKGEPPKGDPPPPPVDRRFLIGGVAVGIALILAMFFWPQPPDPAAGRQKVVFMAEADFVEQEQLQNLAKEFNESQDTMFLDMQLLPYGNMEMKLIVVMAAGESPDLFTLSRPRLQQYAQQGALMNLGSEEEPLWGIPHPGQPRYIAMFVRPTHPEATHVVLEYLLEHLPEAEDPEAMWEQDVESGPMPMPGGFGF